MSFGSDERKKGVGSVTYTYPETALAVRDHIVDVVRTTPSSAVYTRILCNAKSLILGFEGGGSIVKRDQVRNYYSPLLGTLLGHALLVHIVWRNMNHVKHALPT